MSIEKIREALAAGPSAGLWVYSTDDQGTFQVALVERFGVYSEHSEYGGREVGEPEADARFIAACNPAAIHDLLAHIDAQAAEIERLRADADRYRWLRGDSCPDRSLRWAQWEVRRWEAPFWTGDLRRHDLDAAIDATRSKEQKWLT